jgi:hypothetical protein
MSIYTVHEPPLRATETLPDPQRFVFVREGFYFWAFLLPPLWMLWHRLWLVFVVYLVWAAGLAGVMHAAGIGAIGGPVVQLCLSILVGVEASTLRRFTLARRGFKNVGVVSGEDLEAAERRFFDTWVATPRSSSFPAPVAAPTPPTPPPAPAAHPSGIIGLFPEPGAQR